MKRVFTIAISLLIFSCNSSSNSMNKTELKKEAIDSLQKVMQTQHKWVKVHAAEFLIWCGSPDGVKEVYEKEQELYIDEPQYRIGIWRVLAQLSFGDEKEKYQQQVLHAFLDTAGKDRIHAIETMAKLKQSPLPQYKAAVEDALNSDIKSLSAYTHWSIAYTNEDSMKAAKQYFLERILDENEEELPKRIAAYVLRNSGLLEDAQWKLLCNMVLQLPENAVTRLAFANAALLTAPVAYTTTADYNTLRKVFYSYQTKADKGTRMDIASGLAVWGTDEDLPMLLGWLHNTSSTGVPADDADVQASAAYAILKILER